jgi:diguanylate cyclase (GGDEF)-like protein
MLLDFKTLSLMVVISSFLYAVTIAFFALQANQYKGISLYMWGAIHAALGFASTTVYTQFPELFVLRFVSGGFLMLSCYFYCLGITRFLDFDFNSRWLSCCLLSGITAMAYFVFFDSSNAIVGAITPFYGIIFYGIACYLLWLRRSERFSNSLYFVLVNIVLIILIFAARCYYMIAYHVQSPIQDVHIDNSFLLAIFVTGYLRNVGFIMMVSQRLYQDLRETAERDFLTNVYNRRATQQRLEEQFNQFHRYHNSCSIILLDIDYFKAVNDNYGHETGDKVLQKITAILKMNLRKTDILGRWGGEEFLIILPHTDIAKAVEVAEKLRHEIASSDIEGIPCTVSLGVKMLDDNDHTIDEVVKRSDDSLYNAKHNGRNCVVAYA